MKKIIAFTADQPRSDAYRNVAWVYAFVLTVMAVGQLYSFEKFLPLIADYSLPGGQGTAALVAGLIVVAEVFALPFLLRMPLSPLMRWFSLGCGLFVAGIWTGLSVVALTYSHWMNNSGMLGTKVGIHAGAVSLVASLILCALAIYSAIGLRPTSKK